jgi:cysteinyl-tRNA synthetase
VRIFNTLTRRVEEITPLDDRKISMYTCGPTVYRYARSSSPTSCDAP